MSTRETYSKVGRELLAAIATAHPYVISVLLDRLRETIETVGMVSVCLCVCACAPVASVNSWGCCGKDGDEDFKCKRGGSVKYTCMLISLVYVRWHCTSVRSCPCSCGVLARRKCV